jgi:hypothetical protein
MTRKYRPLGKKVQILLLGLRASLFVKYVVAQNVKTPRSAGFARGSVQECVPLLEVCKRRGLIQQADHDALKNSLEISRMLSGLINGLNKRAQ